MSEGKSFLTVVTPDVCAKFYCLCLHRQFFSHFLLRSVPIPPPVVQWRQHSVSCGSTDLACGSLMFTSTSVKILRGALCGRGLGGRAGVGWIVIGGSKGGNSSSNDQSPLFGGVSGHPFNPLRALGEV